MCWAAGDVVYTLLLVLVTAVWGWTFVVVQDAISAVQAAYRRAKLLNEEVRVARQLEDSDVVK